MFPPRCIRRSRWRGNPVFPQRIITDRRRWQGRLVQVSTLLYDLLDSRRRGNDGEAHLSRFGAHSGGERGARPQAPRGSAWASGHFLSSQRGRSRAAIAFVRAFPRLAWPCSPAVARGLVRSAGRLVGPCRVLLDDGLFRRARPRD
jgi:hypothetical protein